MTQKMFYVRSIKQDRNGNLQEISDVLGGAVTEDNAYIAMYNEATKKYAALPTQMERRLTKIDGYTMLACTLSQEHPRTLPVGGRAIRDFALCGEREAYVIERVS